ncbi:MAG: GntR family transcriptional regulator [Actinobacteria bacterium HGW-Actinobacteria-4]|nr:MAG: GntR family transcriptional regulator [Actinobacteria bacterium HGW-Actinobacteria-4]
MVSLLHIDPASPGPLHERIAGSVRRAVLEGEFAPGDTLPAARDLAQTVGVNINTVLRAYRDLRDQGLIDLRRGRGATVRDGAVSRARLDGLADQLLAEAAHLGLTPADITHLLNERKSHESR